MRELKFKAWDKACGVMINPEDSKANKVCFYLNGSVSEDSVWRTSDLIMMQYTGIEDVKQIEIYNDFIMKDKFGKLHVVGLSNSCAAFKVAGSLLSVLLIWSRGLEVVGNIHQNQELLKEVGK